MALVERLIRVLFSWRDNEHRPSPAPSATAAGSDMRVRRSASEHSTPASHVPDRVAIPRPHERSAAQGASPSKRLGDFGKALPPQPPPSGPRSGFVRDPAYEASPGVSEALAAIDGGASAVLIVGRAGTGKTHLIHYLRRRPGGERTAVVAPTGIAALSAGAQTIQSMFMLPPHVLDARNLPDASPPGQLLQRMDRLIIDEISMVRADVMDAINARLQAARRSAHPFGGVQIIMVGDFLQLPPVVDDEVRPLLHGLGYRAPYAFNAHVLQHLEVKPISLEQVYRQKEQEFIEILAKVRLGQDVDQVVALLNARCVRPHRAGVTPLLLTTTRAAAERYNLAGLAALEGPCATFQAEISGEMRIEKDRLPVPEQLELRVGTRVMAAKNDPERRWVNGSLGTVSGIEKDNVTVHFDRSGEQHVVPRAEWERIRQEWDPQRKSVRNRVVASYRQIPLNHAWATTIHKAQGLTLEDVRLDLGQGAFAPGQVYVALSRCRSLDGLSFARPLRATEVQADPMLLAFMGWLLRQDEMAGSTSGA